MKTSKSSARVIGPLCALLLAATSLGGSATPAFAASKTPTCAAIYAHPGQATKKQTSAKSEKSVIATIAKFCPTLKSLDQAVMAALPSEKPAAADQLGRELKTAICAAYPKAKLCSSKR